MTENKKAAFFSCESPRHAFPFAWNSFKIHLPNIVSYMWKGNKVPEKLGHEKTSCLVQKNVKWAGPWVSQLVVSNS